MGDRRDTRVMAARTVLAVDGGNSKAEALLVAADGAVLGAVRTATVSHQQVGLEGTATRLRALTDRLLEAAGPEARRPSIASLCLAGADFPAEVRRLRRAIEPLRLADELAIRNDTRAVLRAGSSRPWGVALVCGQGVNGVAVGPTGRTAGFDALGDISGDWGGGGDVGPAGLAAAVRAADGRGPATSLRARVPAHFGRRSVGALVHDLYAGRIPERRLAELSPLVFAEAAAGDRVAGGIVDRLAEELATMAIALLRRTGQLRLDADVVLAGSVLQADHPRLHEGIASRLRAAAPRARLVRLGPPPVLGAALLGLDALPLADRRRRAAEARLHEEVPTVEFGRSPLR